MATCNQFSNLITRYNCLSDIHVLAESKISFKNKEKLFEKKTTRIFSDRWIIQSS